FYDPAIYLKNRELTFVGRIDGYENRKIGLTDSRFPRVAAEVVYLWPLAPGLDPRYPYPRRPWPWAGWEWSDGKY
ncbi:MAG: Slp family lipoprotein, partial [Pseudomonadota bacterium]|nr:Slp family lipoprotein [Pseudomonadota bacterium]